MMMNLSSGNQTVDEMAMINISGNVIPQTWYRTVTRENGKPYLMAIAMLADIVYWYRPTEVRDEQTGCTVRWQKKFHGEYLQKNYKAYEDLFGESKRVVKSALDRLIEIGVVGRILRDIKTDSGMLRNVMYLSLNVEKLRQLTFPEEYPVEVPSDAEDDALEDESDDAEADFGHDVQNLLVVQEEIPVSSTGNGDFGQKKGWSQICDDVVTNLSPRGTENVTTSSHECYDVPTNLSSRGTENVMTSSHECNHMVTDLSGRGHGNVGTNTKNTTENTTKSTTKNTTQITPIQDGMDEIHPSIQKEDPVISRMQEDIATVRKNINYDWHLANRNWRDNRRYQELFDLICDTLCINASYVNIGGTQVPFFRVREKMLALKEEHLDYVLECMGKNEGRIGNIQAYLVKCLYNAPSTVDSWYEHEVRYDMYGGGNAAKG